jgi:hypothetical protein
VIFKFSCDEGGNGHLMIGKSMVNVPYQLKTFSIVKGTLLIKQDKIKSQSRLSRISKCKPITFDESEKN